MNENIARLADNESLITEEMAKKYTEFVESLENERSRQS
jgi:hypothetical protein